MRKNVYAHTETAASYPGYISINQEENGAHSVAVRNRGGQVAATIEMDRDQLEAMARGILNHLELDHMPVISHGKRRGGK